jgi:hypothetical protein
MNFDHFIELAAALWSNAAHWGPVALPLLGAALAGPAGGRVDTCSDSEMPDLVRGLLSGSARFVRRLRDRMKSFRLPEKASLVLNNSCNLSCKHCYLQVPKLTGPTLSQDEWTALAASIMEAPIPYLCLAGKEVFLAKKNIDLLARFDAMNQAGGHPTRLGVVTNGTLITPYREFLKSLRLDYLDISLDGDRRDHDAVRGQGAFDAAKDNVRWAAVEMAQPYFLSMTLQRQNFRRIAQALNEFEHLGVSHVGMGFMVPTSRTDPALKLTPEEIAETINGLGALETLALARPMKVVFELNTQIPEGLFAFVRSPWFVPEAIEADRFDNPWIEHRLSNGLLLQFKFLVTPCSSYRCVRITPEGHYLALDDIFDTDRYADHVLANVRDHDFDFVRSTEAARNHPRTQAIVDSYERDILPRLIHAYADSMKNRRMLAA